jgi:hypothetical protein
MSALDEIVELYEAQHSDGYVAKRFRSIEGPKLVAIARAAEKQKTYGAIPELVRALAALDEQPEESKG